jgi:hypothetical protein
MDSVTYPGQMIATPITYQVSFPGRSSAYSLETSPYFCSIAQWSRIFTVRKYL